MLSSSKPLMPGTTAVFFEAPSPSLSSEDEDDDDEDDEPEEQEDDEDEELDPDRDEDEAEDEDLDEELDEELEEDASESDSDLLLASLRLLLLSFFCFRLSELGASGLVRAASICLSFSPAFSSFNPSPVSVGGLSEGQLCVPASSPSRSSSSLGVTSLGVELVSGEGEAPGVWLCAEVFGVRICPTTGAWFWTWLCACVPLFWL